MPKGTLLLFTSIVVVGLLLGCERQVADKKATTPTISRPQSATPNQTTIAAPRAQLVGRYEAMTTVPRMQIPDADPARQKQLDAQMRQLHEMGRMIMEFEGSKVWFGTSAAIAEYSYRVNGNQLELIAEGMGQKVIVPMTIESDGSITYQTFHFRRVR